MIGHQPFTRCSRSNTPFPRAQGCEDECEVMYFPPPRTCQGNCEQTVMGALRPEGWRPCAPVCWADGWAGTGLAPRGGPVGESGRCGWTGRCRESTCRNPAPAAEAASSIARLLCPQDGSQDRSRRPGPLPALLSSRGGSGRGGRNRGADAGSPKGAHCEVRTLRGLPGCRGGAWTGRGRARGSEEAGAGAERLNGALSVGVGRANADEHSQVVGVCRENGEQSRSPLWPGSLWGIVRGPGGAGDRGGGRPGRCGAGLGGGVPARREAESLCSGGRASLRVHGHTDDPWLPLGEDPRVWAASSCSERVPRCRRIRREGRPGARTRAGPGVRRKEASG